MDCFTKDERSAIMRKVRSKDTTPEKKVRSYIHRLGFRFRLHNEKLPGKPDLVFARKKKIIFVHGCFWHGHDCKAGRKKPKSNVEYWGKKIQRNLERDKLNLEILKKMNWEVLVIWECETKDESRLSVIIEEFIGVKK
jgi:DNA mismatch endonuclease (patch repair protein)